jgi:hypothetical protein
VEGATRESATGQKDPAGLWKPSRRDWAHPTTRSPRGSAPPPG